MFLYGLVYGNEKKDYLYLIVQADSEILARRKAEEDVVKWKGFSILSVNFLSVEGLKAGNVVFVGG
ncbi:MAG: hypothetical protein E3J66_00090 [Dehalococcoidia bacterium]|nr:MAG: hypothetical protein E3J66_00090 [Dehalococcoidia bacterium]